MLLRNKLFHFTHTAYSIILSRKQLVSLIITEEPIRTSLQ